MWLLPSAGRLDEHGGSAAVVHALISDCKDSLHSTSDFSERPNEVALPCL